MLSAMSDRQHDLLTSQQDAVFDIVRGKGFDPSDFEWARVVGRVYGGSVPRLIHGPTRSEFIFDFNPENKTHYGEWSPGEGQARDDAYAGDWGSMQGYIIHWLDNVERERSAPNFWAQLGKQRELLAATEPKGDKDNTPFSLEEQAQIAAQLNEIKELLVKTHGADRGALEGRVENLVKASTRLGRRDWLTIFLGTMFTWTLEGLVPPEGLREALMIAAHGLGHLFGGGVPQLPLL
jgi:hypothetical protein